MRRPITAKSSLRLWQPCEPAVKHCSLLAITTEKEGREIIMYSKLLVPLDGSPLAEKALPYAVLLAKRLNAHLLLVQTLRLGPRVNGTSEAEKSEIKNAEAYLERVREILTDRVLATRLAPEQVQTLVVYDEPMGELPLIAEMEKADLIVMTTHGHTGIGRLILGSHAAEVVQHSRLPVILIRPFELNLHSLTALLSDQVTFSPDLANRPIIVTLDGTAQAELAIVPALEIAQGLGSKICLLRVVAPVIPTNPAYLVSAYGSYYGSEIAQESRHRHHEPYQYLDELQLRLGEKGVDCLKMVCEGDAAKEIVAYARKLQAGMLVMATHARGKTGEVFVGSVAEQVMRHSSLPVMLINMRLYSNPKNQPEPKEVTATAG